MQANIVQKLHETEQLAIWGILAAGDGRHEEGPGVKPSPSEISGGPLLVLRVDQARHLESRPQLPVLGNRIANEGQSGLAQVED